MKNYRTISVFDDQAYRMNHTSSSSEFKEIKFEEDQITFSVPVRYYKNKDGSYFAEQYIAPLAEWSEIEFNRVYPKDSIAAYMNEKRFECMAYTAILSNEKNFALSSESTNSKSSMSYSAGSSVNVKGKMPTSIYLKNSIRDILDLNNIKISPYVCGLIEKDLIERGLITEDNI